VSATQIPTPFTAEHVIAVVKQLPPGELRKFSRKFIAWQQQGHQAAEDEALLLARIEENSRLPAADQRRFDRLRRKRQAETLTKGEETELQAFWQRVERMDATRLAALHELAQRRGRSVKTLMHELGVGKRRNVFPQMHDSALSTGYSLPFTGFAVSI
jgi:hypothetical protein